MKGRIKIMNADERKEIGGAEGDAFGVAEAVVDLKRERRGFGEMLKRITWGFLWSFFAYLLGLCELPFGAHPLGVALLCAADKKTPYIFVGLIISAFRTDKPVVWVCVYLATFMIRVLLRLTVDRPDSVSEEGAVSASDMLSGLFLENVLLRMTTACIGVFIIGLYKLIEGGFLYYDLYGVILAMVVALLAVILTHGVFNGSVTASRFGYFSASVLTFGVVYAARGVSFYGILLAAFGTMLVTLYVCRKKGIAFGVAAGMIGGLAYSPIFAPAFIFAALAAGVLWRVSVVFAATTAFSVGVAWGLYVSGIGALSSLMPALLAAATLFVVLDKLFFSVVPSVEKEEEEEAAVETVQRCEIGTDMLSEVRLDSAEQRIKSLCSTFSEMSKFFCELGERMRTPLAGDVKQICDRAFDACCGNCKNREVCWEQNYADTIACVASVSAYVHRNGRVCESDISREMRNICERLPDITDEINHNYAAHSRQLMLCDRTEIFALDYEAMSDLLAAAMSGEE